MQDSADDFDYIFKHSQRYRFLRPLGKGAYGAVISAQDLVTNRKVAIKRIGNLGSRLVCTRTLREIKLLKHFNDHECVTKLFTCLLPTNNTFDEVFLVLELMEADLHYIITSKQPLSLAHVKYLTFQLLSALEIIHKAGVIHRDVKPSNILVNSNCKLKLCDFGLAREGNSGSVLTNYVQTRWYRAPELLFGNKEYDEKVDLWSVGCILMELFLRRPFLPGKNTQHQKELIIKHLGTPAYSFAMLICQEEDREFILNQPKLEPIDFSRLIPSASADAIDLLVNLLMYDSGSRLDARNALNHVFLRENVHEDKEIALFTDYVPDGVKINVLRQSLLKEVTAEHRTSKIEKSRYISGKTKDSTSQEQT